MTRRVGSASAWKTRSTLSPRERYLSIYLTILPRRDSYQEVTWEVGFDISDVAGRIHHRTQSGTGQRLGDDGERLHDWMFDVGVGPWGDPPALHMPVFVVTHEAREPLVKQGGSMYHS
jgi:hypothetical protein